MNKLKNWKLVKELENLYSQKEFKIDKKTDNISIKVDKPKPIELTKKQWELMTKYTRSFLWLCAVLILSSLIFWGVL
tara:strand:- start:536 stop:766 length:231 start_codon:yes stop_codon:yes gene_type:complete